MVIPALPGQLCRIFTVDGTMYIAYDDVLYPVDMDSLCETLLTALRKILQGDPSILLTHVLFFHVNLESEYTLLGTAKILHVSRCSSSRRRGPVDFDFQLADTFRAKWGKQKPSQQWLLVNCQTLFCIRFSEASHFVYLPRWLGILSTEWQCLACWVIVHHLTGNCCSSLTRLLQDVFADRLKEQPLRDHWNGLCASLGLQMGQLKSVFVALGCPIAQRSKRTVQKEDSRYRTC